MTPIAKNIHTEVIMNKSIWGAALIVGIIASGVVLFAQTGKTSGDAGVQSEASTAPYAINKEMLAAQLGNMIRLNQYPNEFQLSVDGGRVPAQVQYALDESSQSLMQKLMNSYKPDYGAFVAMDASTGRVLSIVSYSREHTELENLALRATFPAASIFKVVTASAAIDLKKAEPETIVPFNGANHTLYKRNVEETRVTRWTKHMTMREAFGRSVNVFFGKLGLFYVGADNLLSYANRFMFNQPIRADMPVQTGYARFSSEDPWSVVTAASGFTRENTMSPLHGALIASAIANDGVMMEPFLIESLVDSSGSVIYKAAPRQASIVVNKESAEELRDLFQQTVRAGTSRKAFRQTVRRQAFEEVEFGGKTGSLTGDSPAGKCDWFVGYARYRDRRIAVAALTVNEKKWRVKSSTLANYFFTHYLKIHQDEERFANVE